MTSLWFVVLVIDLPFFELGEPNRVGLSAAQMHFGGRALLVAPSWVGKRCLEESENWLYIRETRWHRVLWTRGPSARAAIPAAASELWETSRPPRLQRYILRGRGSDPAAVELVFDLTTITLSLGHADPSQPDISDDEDLLIFRDTSWPPPIALIGPSMDVIADSSLPRTG